jgi:transcriptional regulator with XRE-family HTH domain
VTESKLDPEAVRLGATIRALREAHGLTVPQLAAAIGLSDRYLRYIESGEKKVTPQVCHSIAGTLNVPLAAITVEGYEQIAATS